jgi:hypothetical protein
MNKNTPLINQFKAARRVSTPLIAVSTPDPAATIKTIADGVDGTGPEETMPALVQWDVVRGITPLNEEAREGLKSIASPNILINPVSALEEAVRLPKKAILFVHNAPRLFSTGDVLAVIQAIWNLRDTYKSDGRTLVLLGPEFDIPVELSHDIMLIEEPLPDENQLRAIVDESFEAVDIALPGDEDRNKAVAALLGLAAQQAEQVTAMSLTRKGLNMDMLWERKRQVIEEVPGLTVWRGEERFSDIGGLTNIKDLLLQVIAGKKSPRVFLYIDEMDKKISTQDNSSDGGVSGDQLATILSQMQDNQWTGITCFGPPGTSKSFLAKAAGNEAGVPTILLDLGACKGSLVGESEQKLRRVFKVIKAMAGDRVFVISTLNAIAGIPLELRRRFTYGTYFFDLPTAQERQEIWALYAKKYGLELEKIDDTDWSGADIFMCCDLAYNLECRISEAAARINPVALSAPDKIHGLRASANGKFLSASEPGFYKMPIDPTHGTANNKRRSIELPQEN